MLFRVAAQQEQTWVESVKWLDCWAQRGADDEGGPKVIKHNNTEIKSSIMQLERVKYCIYITLEWKQVGRAKGEGRNENREEVMDWGSIVLLS